MATKTIVKTLFAGQSFDASTVSSAHFIQTVAPCGFTTDMCYETPSDLANSDYAVGGVYAADDANTISGNGNFRVVNATKIYNATGAEPIEIQIGVGIIQYD